jgi:hypothetical protein
LEGAFAVLFFANALPEGHPWVGGNGKENKNMEGVLTGVWRTAARNVNVAVETNKATELKLDAVNQTGLQGESLIVDVTNEADKVWPGVFPNTLIDMKSAKQVSKRVAVPSAPKTLLLDVLLLGLKHCEEFGHQASRSVFSFRTNDLHIVWM